MKKIIEVEGLKKHYPITGGFLSKLFREKEKNLYAVDGVSFDIREGETLALVGESGCGKTTIGKCILRLIEPTAGSVHFMNKDILKLDRNELDEIRCQMQIIFQDPYASLNPRKTIGQILRKPYITHSIFAINEIEANVLKLMGTVELTPPETFINRYPHELSGGQRQRVVIARALSLKPFFIVADEPVSSLDISIRAQILNLLKDLKQKFHLTSLFITHELNVVRSISDRVAVMYLGKFVEIGPVKEIFNNPIHPYTQALLSATPIPNPKRTREKKRIILHGELPSSIDPPKGCRFHSRCPIVQDNCVQNEPELAYFGNNHFVACFMVK